MLKPKTNGLLTFQGCVMVELAQIGIVLGRSINDETSVYFDLHITTDISFFLDPTQSILTH